MLLTMKQARRIHKFLFTICLEKGKPREKLDNYISFRQWLRNATFESNVQFSSPKLQEILKCK